MNRICHAHSTRRDCAVRDSCDLCGGAMSVDGWRDSTCLQCAITGELLRRDMIEELYVLGRSPGEIADRIGGTTDEIVVTLLDMRDAGYAVAA